MRNEIAFLHCGDKEYPLTFNLNVMEELQDEYGSLDKWGEVTQGDGGEPNVKALKKGLLIMMNEAIDIQNEKNGSDNKFITDKQIGRIITEVGIDKVVEAIQHITIESTKSDNDSKNE